LILLQALPIITEFDHLFVCFHSRSKSAVLAFKSRVHVRVGGSLADFVTYDIDLPAGESCLPFSAPTTSGIIGYAYGFGCLPMDRWDALNGFISDTGASLIFGTSALKGRTAPVCPNGTDCQFSKPR
jgi:hypothetical protein